MRRAAVGASIVDRTLENTDDFNRPMQELVTSLSEAQCGHAMNLTAARAGC